jgi:hypothetical protein
MSGAFQKAAMPSPHFNIRFLRPISNSVARRHFIGLDPKRIEWVHIVQTKRHASHHQSGNKEP